MSGIVVLILRLLAAIVLLAFLSWAVMLAWKGIGQQGQTLVNRRIPTIGLTYHDGDKYSTPRHYAQQAEIILGRDPGCDFPLTDETASTRHAQLAYHHGQWWLQDLQSTNGTFLNDQRVETPTVITASDEIRCGKASLTVDLPSDIFISPTLKIPNSSN